VSIGRYVFCAVVFTWTYISIVVNNVFFNVANLVLTNICQNVFICGYYIYFLLELMKFNNDGENSQYNIEVRRPFVHGLWLLLNKSFLYLSNLLKWETSTRRYGVTSQNLRSNTVTIFSPILFVYSLTKRQIRFRGMRFDVLPFANIKTAIFWNIIPFSLVDGYRCFGGTCVLHIQLLLP
jgi:hypothetical protein